MCLVVDEVGGNTNQKGDGNVGGELQLCEAGNTPQQKINTKDKHYTVLGLTALTGEPVMCIVIFAGNKEHAIVETGLDLSAPTIGSPNDADFVEKNSGKGKRFPGGPTCQFKGKTIPCLCRWSKKGSITAEILRAILATLDHLKVYDRSTGAKPFLLLDGHRSRLEYSFLEYVCNPDHEWVICIGVPYGTAVWQVGDSPEQNGSFNMASVVRKREIVNEQDKYMCDRPTISAHDIIGIINYAWSKSFARVDSNKKAIAERGWFPYNRNLMLDPSICASITREEEANELLDNSVIIVPFKERVKFTNLIDLSPTFDAKFISEPIPEEKKKGNYSTGVAAWCLDNIVQQHDLHAARGRIKKNREVGKSLKEKLVESKGITAGRLFKAGSCRIGKTIFDIQKENRAQAEEVASKKERDAKVAYRKARDAADTIIAKNPNPKSWSNAELKLILTPLKTKDDGAMPTLKKKMLEAYETWKNRPPPPLLVAPKVIPLEAAAVFNDAKEEDHNLLTNEEEAVAAMMDLGAEYAV